MCYEKQEDDKDSDAKPLQFVRVSEDAFFDLVEMVENYELEDTVNKEVNEVYLNWVKAGLHILSFRYATDDDA